jgi:multidrug efflux pump subunit AcrA (membrane-fusion protein)
VSGATLVINASAAKADAILVEKGTKASFVLPDGTEGVATVTLVAPATPPKKDPDTTSGGSDTQKTDAGRYDIQLVPDALTPEQLTQLKGTNVRVRIPVSSTKGEVLAVPLAALTAGAGGESRVEVSTGVGDKTRLVEVTTGLAANGFVEVRSPAGKLSADDLVVVGR